MGTLNFHDAFGKIDLSLINADDLDALSEEQRALLLDAITAGQNLEAAERRVCEARAAVENAMRSQHEAMAAHVKVNPPIDRIAAMRDVIAANRK